VCREADTGTDEQIDPFFLYWPVEIVTPVGAHGSVGYDVTANQTVVNEWLRITV
jgi:hypothetical protein